jgi:hypothetical protein
MLEVATDRRRIEAEPDEGAHERAVALGRRYVELQVGLARELSRIEATKTYVAHECVSIEEYGVRWVGVAARDARQLVDLGRALDAAATTAIAEAMAGERGAAAGDEPDALPETPPEPPSDAPSAQVPTVADAVLAGALSVERAALAGRFVADPELIRDGENAVALATAGSLTQVRATLRFREEALAQQEKVTTFTLVVTERARDGFRRARGLASEAAGAMLTEGETFSLVVERYLDLHDPQRRGEGARRVGDTADLPGRRYVPAEAKRAVRARAGDQCEVPGCPRRHFLELAHIEAHCDGGDREEENLLLLCHGHHVLFDAGRIRFAGWEDGRATFSDRAGRRLEERTGDAREASAREPSERAPTSGEVCAGESEDLGSRRGASVGVVAGRSESSRSLVPAKSSSRSSDERRGLWAGGVAEAPPTYGRAPTASCLHVRGPP